MCRGTSSEGSATIPSGNSGKSRTSGTAIQSKPVAVSAAMTALVWFRRDLRVHDHPALRAALDAHERVVPVFVLDDRVLRGRFASEQRERFLYGCLHDLRAALRERGGELVVAHGAPERELPALAREHGATTAYFASDVSPFALGRDRA